MEKEAKESTRPSSALSILSSVISGFTGSAATLGEFVLGKTETKIPVRREVHLTRGPNGFGMTVRGPIERQFKTSDGKLVKHAVQRISEVVENGPAQQGGIQPGDCIFKLIINGRDVETADHDYVCECIKKTDELTLIVVSDSDYEAKDQLDIFGQDILRGVELVFQNLDAAFGGDKHLPDPQHLQNVFNVMSGHVQPKNQIEWRLVDEKNINNELVGELFVRSAYIVRNSIGRIINGNKAIGTGFRVSKRLIMTAAHVAKALDPGNSFIQFHHFDDPIANCPAVDDKTPKSPGIKFQKETFHCNGNAPLDYAILATDEEIPDQVSVVKYVYEGDVEHLSGKHINILSHPDGDSMKCSLRKNLAVTQDKKEKLVAFSEESFLDQAKLQNVILNEADTDGGSSGAPMFNDDFQLIGIHQGFLSSSQAAQSQTKPVVCNRGCLISFVLSDMYSQGSESSTEFEQKLKGKKDELGVPFEGTIFTKNFCSTKK